MCMKTLFTETNIFDKFTAFLTLPIFDRCTYGLMGNSAYFVKSTPPRAFSVAFEYFADILQTCCKCA